MVVRAQQVYHCRKPQVDEASEALQNEVRRTIAIGVSRTGESITGVSCHIMNQYKKMKRITLL